MMNDKLEIDQLIQQFFRLFNNIAGHETDWETVHSLCIPEVIIIKKSGTSQEVYGLDSFIKPRKEMLSNGTLKEFEEEELTEETNIIGNLAQRTSVYQKKGYVNGSYFEGKGNKLFQLIRTEKGWRISAVIWEDI